jgi:uncharacterized phiE125 gp8 family phage protein
MTIVEMRGIVGLDETATDAEVVAAYAALIDDGIPASLPIVEPVTVAQVRLHCKIEEDEEDDLIAQKISAAREWVEDYTGRIVAQRTLVQHFRSWGTYLELYTRPVVSIVSIAYDGAAGGATITDAAYSTGINPVRIYPPGSGWPALRAGGAITVAYTAGYAEGEAPRSMIEAIIVLVAGMLDERAGAYDKAAAAAERLLARLRSMAIA